MKTIRKAVFPVAGLGSRFLPITKASPKEMLPIVDKPLIQFAVEEAAAAGITEMIFITGRNKRAIEDHFDKAYELETELELRGKSALLDQVQSVTPPGISCIYIRQTEALGLGHAVMCAEPVVNGEPFAVILADDLLIGETPVMKQMVDLYARKGRSILGVERIRIEDSASYGIVDCTESIDAVRTVKAIVEKPQPQDAPSNLGVVGRYVLDAAIFNFLRQGKRGAGGEIQLTDAIAELIKSQDVLAYEFEGRRFDCGSKLGYLQATVEMGLLHPQLGFDFEG